MTSYEFEPGKRRGRNRYVGSWTETPSKKIDLAITVANLRQVLTWGASSRGAPCTHQDIAHWCDAFHMAIRERRETTAVEERAGDITYDVYCQWLLTLANTYTLEQLQRMDHSIVTIPAEWFTQWLKQLDQL